MSCLWLGVRIFFIFTYWYTSNTYLAQRLTWSNIAPSMYSHCTYVCGFEFRLSHLRASLSFPFSRFESSLCTLWRPVLSFQNLRLDTLYVYMCTTCIFFLHLFSHIHTQIYTLHKTSHLPFSNTNSRLFNRTKHHQDLVHLLFWNQF